MHCACLLHGPGWPWSFSGLVYGFFSNRCKCAELPVPCRNMKSTLSAQTLVAVLLFLLLPGHAKAHLGIVLSREARGPFVITVFTSSEVVRGQPADVSVLVQRRDSNEPILDGIVSFVLTPPRGSLSQQADPICGQPASVTLSTPSGSRDGQSMFAARREQSSNKLLYAASVNLPLVGAWELEALVRHGAESANLTCEIPVGLPTRRLPGLAPYLAVPLLLAGLFAINQCLRTPYPTK